MSKRDRLSTSPSNFEKRSKGNREERITEENKGYQSEDADIILVSSDELSFKVHKWALMSSSKVFRNMLTIGVAQDNAEIELTHEEIEHSTVIKAFLDIVYSSKIIEFPAPHADPKLLYSLIDFLQKYDATYPMELLKYAIQPYILNNSTHNLDMFIAGCKLDSIEVCAAAIKSTEDAVWQTVKESPRDAGSIEGRHLLDLAAAPLARLAEIPEKYKWALLRASTIVGPDENIWIQDADATPTSWLDQKAEIANEFERLLR